MATSLQEKSNDEETQKKSSTDCSLATQWNKLPSPKAFLSEYNPDKQYAICQDKELCFSKAYPTLRHVAFAYGNNTPVTWLYAHLLNLSEYCGCKEKLSPHQLLDCAHIINTEYGHLTIAELMLFFFNFKAGKYGKFYGVVDPMAITAALMEFITGERNSALYEQYQKQHEHKDILPTYNYVEWCKKNGKDIIAKNTPERATDVATALGYNLSTNANKTQQKQRQAQKTIKNK